MVYCRRALAKARLAQDRLAEASTWDSLGFAHHQLGDPVTAISCYRLALETYPEAGDPLAKADFLAHLGEAQHDTGDRRRPGRRGGRPWRLSTSSATSPAARCASASVA